MFENEHGSVPSRSPRMRYSKYLISTRPRPMPYTTIYGCSPSRSVTNSITLQLLGNQSLLIFQELLEVICALEAVVGCEDQRLELLHHRRTDCFFTCIR